MEDWKKIVSSKKENDPAIALAKRVDLSLKGSIGHMVNEIPQDDDQDRDILEFNELFVGKQSQILSNEHLGLVLRQMQSHGSSQDDGDSESPNILYNVFVLM